MATQTKPDFDLEHRIGEAADQGGWFKFARKEHRCCGCKQPITPGTRYFAYVANSGPFQTGDPYHVACAEKEWL